MYITLKKLSAVCGILTAVNIAMTIFLLFALPMYNMSFAFNFTVSVLLVSLSLMFLFLSIALRNTYDLLELEYENVAGKLRELDKKVQQLEEKM